MSSPERTFVRVLAEGGSANSKRSVRAVKACEDRGLVYHERSFTGLLKKGLVVG